MTWKLFSSPISIKDIRIEVKIDEYFDNTNSSDDNEEDSIGEAGKEIQLLDDDITMTTMILIKMFSGRILLTLMLCIR